MPRQRVGDIEMYYEVHGNGPRTLVMIRGLGSNLLSWYEQIEFLAQHYRCIVFDNRGAGRTDKPDAPYSIKGMADDTAGLMDALGITRAALLGISMGGMIAQEFALHHQEKLSCLILGCTHFGGASVAQSPPEIVAAVMAGTNATPAQQHQQLQAVFCDDTIANRREVVEKHNRIRAQYPIPPYAFLRQTQAIGVFDARARLNQIRVPTMVITGREDRLVAPQNSKLIAERIPGSKLVELPGGHLFMAEYPEQFNRAVIDFIDAHR
ncbi:MAG TPA: alpha/beta fold hydrolase [Candidatus Binataceae bacterium]|nr:alpha/beta fold hydrolase [Candidatus Binataceae bacterium]